MQNIREKLKRKLSMHDKNANFENTNDDDAEFDEETTGHLHNEIERAEAEGQPQGRPGSFLNRLISSGNKKTEDELMRDAQRMKEEDKARAAASGAGATSTT